MTKQVKLLVLIAVILAVIFLLKPILSFVLDTEIPVAHVISYSMFQWDDWWERGATCPWGPCLQKDFYGLYGISEEEFNQFPYNKGIVKGSVFLVEGVSVEEIDIGDVVLYRNATGGVIIHRVIQVESTGDLWTVIFKADSMPEIDEPMIEVTNNDERIIGRAIFRIRDTKYVK